jgi:hypothetical protein
MRTCAIVLLTAGAIATGPVMAQQASPIQNQQSEADKSVKTRNSGESSYVGDQEKSGASAQPPGRPDSAAASGNATTSPSAQNSGTGISGAPGNKNGPPQGTVGSNSQNLHVQEQDPANVKGLPGNKSGPPAKR